MTRPIDADFLKKRIEYGQGLVEFTANQIEELLEVIDDTPTVERPHGEWIPCSERLPEKDGRYLVTRTSYITRKPEVSISFFDSTTKEFYPNCIAWMPLPEPYKGEGDENET